jgi:hypothetical protein
LRRTVLAESFGDNINVLKERPDELEELGPRGRKREWPTLKEFRAE